MSSTVRALLLVVLLALVVRVPLLWAGFIDYDDGVLIYENPIVTWLDAAHLYQVSFTNFRLEHQNLMYLANLLNYAAAGGDYAGFIVVNLAWWSLTVVVLHGFAGLFLHDTRARLAAALLFSVHAINTDTIAWISARGHLLGLPFALAALTVWGHRPRTRLAPLWNLTTLVLLAIAVYAKLVFAGALVGLFCVDLYQQRSLRSWIGWVDKLPAVLLMLWAVPWPGSRITPEVTDQHRFYARLSGLVNYLYALCVPIRTHFETWDAPGKTLFDPGGSGMPMSGMPPILHLGILAAFGLGLALLYRRGNRAPLVLAVLALALVAPSMLTRSLLPGVAVSYRYAFGASACFCVALVSVLEHAWNALSQRERGAVVAAFLLLAGAHAFHSHRQAWVWQSQQGLWESCVANFPVTWHCHIKAKGHRAFVSEHPRAGRGLLIEAAHRRRLTEGRGRPSDLAFVIARSMVGQPDEAYWLRRALEEDELSPERERAIHRMLGAIETETETNPKQRQ